MFQNSNLSFFELQIFCDVISIFKIVFYHHVVKTNLKIEFSDELGCYIHADKPRTFCLSNRQHRHPFGGVLLVSFSLDWTTTAGGLLDQLRT